MKAAWIASISLVALVLTGCITGDELTSYVIEPDGAIDFFIYRLNLTSDQAGERAAKEFTDYFQELEGKRGSLFRKLAEANAQSVNVSVIRKASPASVLITGRIPSLDDFAGYISDKAGDMSLIGTAIARDSTRGLLFQIIREPSTAKARPDSPRLRADSFNMTQFVLVEGYFTKAEGFQVTHKGRSALLDEDALSKMLDSRSRSITLSLEWQIPK